MPVTAPEVKAIDRPLARLSDEAWAVRTLARTEISMPAKPAAPDRIAPRAKPTGCSHDLKKKASRAMTTTPTMAIVVYWRFR
jgi:hypothetical protein